MKNIKLTIQYDGTRYKGWQKQNTGKVVSTVQDKIETVLSKMMKEEIQVIGCGRTDTGVHADNYIANFKTNSSASMEEIKEYLLMYLPEDIVIKSVKECSERFHARLNVIKKSYVYTIDNNPYCDVFNKKYAYNVQEKLNLRRMEGAIDVLVGTHDFQSFTNLKPKNGKSTVRTINSIKIEENNNIIKIYFEGNGFLLNMVRILTGTLIEVGKGSLSAEDVERILLAKTRAEGGHRAPAKGLCMNGVEY